MSRLDSVCVIAGPKFRLHLSKGVNVVFLLHRRAATAWWVLRPPL